jgi:hypothetical protein
MRATGIAGFAFVLALGLGVSTAASQQANGTISGKATDEARQPYSDYAVQLRDVTTGQVTTTRPLDQQGLFSFTGVALTRPYLVELFHTKERRVICTEGPVTLTATQTLKSDVSINCGKAPAALWVLLAGAGAAAAIAVAARSVSR